MELSGRHPRAPERTRLGAALVACLAAASSAVVVTAHASAASPAPLVSAPVAGAAAGLRPGVMPLVRQKPSQPAAAAPNAQAAASAKNVSYYGGKVISNVEVVQVLYGEAPPDTPTWEAQVANTTTPNIATFYTGITASPFVDWMAEYATPSQVIGKGSFIKTATLTPTLPAATPSAANNYTIDDSSIQKELTLQVKATTLPAPNANTLYAIYFPHGVTITQGSPPATSGVDFCAYHGTVAPSTGVPELYYSVLPDFTTGGMTTGCGNGTEFQNVTAVSSHEFAEAITDPEVGRATTYAAPLAWYDANPSPGGGDYGEIGDICNGQDVQVAGTDGLQYMVQREWSNQQTGCVVAPAPPVVNRVAPSTGPSTGGTAVTISGSGFTGATDVFFGSTDVKSACPASGSSGCFTVVNPTTIAATTPASAAAGSVTITVATPAGTSPGGGAPTYLYVAPGVYTPLQPYRVLDTRQGSCVNCGNLGPVGSGATRTFSLAFTGQVPASALSVVLNVTAVNATRSTYVTVYPSGASQPTASNLNLASAAPISNLVVSAVGTNRSLNAYNLSGSVDLIVDVQGYFAAPAGINPAGQFHAVSPTRVCDTRPGTGTPCSNSPLGSQQWRQVTLTNLSNAATAAAFNLTGTGDAADTYLSVAPPNGSDQCPGAAPTFSNLNLSAGATQPIRVVVPVGPNHDVCVFNLAASINVILDVNGYFGAAGDTTGSRFYAVAPVRLCDTRSAGYACPPGALGQGGVVTIPASQMGAPVAIAANATAVLPSASTFITLYPSDVGLPNASDLNVVPSQVLPNFAFVKVASGGAQPGSVNAYNLAGSVNVLLDLVGWFQ